MDPEQFVADFPEFANPMLYPASSITYWLTVASYLVNQGLWGSLYNTGIELYTAHNLVLEAQAQRTANNGAPGGVTQGPIASKTVDKVTIAFAVEAAKEDGAGEYNTTIYGKRFWHLTQLIGAGGMQLGAGGFQPGSAGYFPF